MKKSIQPVFLVFVFLLVFLSGCAPASTPVLPTSTPSPIPTQTPTLIPTLIPTPIPTNTMPAPFQCEMNIRNSDVEPAFIISGESGSSTLEANTSTNFTPEGRTKTLDWTVTYDDTKNSYHITGDIVFNSQTTSVTSYEITATGGLFGDTGQICKGP